nr:MAG TPA: Single strand binding protein [Caudoviricetes sp.]
MLNHVVIMGRMVRDPELRQLDNGTSVTSFSVAVDRNYVDKTTNERQADFLNVVAWRQTAEFVCKYFHQGDMIALEGSLQSRKYTDKDGNNRTAIEIVASNISFCGGKNGGNANTATTNDAPATMVANAPSEDNDELPF